MSYTCGFHSNLVALSSLNSFLRSSSTLSTSNDELNAHCSGSLHLTALRSIK